MPNPEECSTKANAQHGEMCNPLGEMPKPSWQNEQTIKAKCPNPQGKMPKPQGKMLNPQGKIPNPQGKMPNLQGKMANPQGKMFNQGEMFN